MGCAQELRDFPQLLCLILLWAAPSSLAADVELTFQLIPEATFQEGAEALSPQDYLPSGEVLLYPRGRYTPTLVAKAGEPVVVPSGDWTWIAEAPGWVSVAAGALNVRPGDAAKKSILWPVVPACRLEIVGPDAYRGLDRVDLVSLERGAVYPLVPRRRAAWIPAGRYLAYSVGSRGLRGISRPQSCGVGEERVIGPPPDPARDRHHLMVSFTTPPETDLYALTAALTSRQEAAVLPTAVARTRQRATYFWLDLPADARRRLQVEHGELRTLRSWVESPGGTAQQLPTYALRPRADLTLDLDVRSLAGFDNGQLEISFCGLREVDRERFNRHECEPLPRSLVLEEGLQRYVFEKLDTGQYQVDAIIDDQRIAGAGSYLTPYLGPEDVGFDLMGPFPLWEHEISGQLLVDGEAVAGEVQLLSIDGADKPRVFPTDHTDTYRLTYFATVANRFDLHAARLPEDFIDRPATERMGLFGPWVQMRACADGACRQYHVDSTWIGGGRLDLDLGAARRLTVEVHDGSSGQPLDGVLVAYRPADPEIHFVAGEVTFEEPSDAHAVGALTDGRGRVAFRGLPDAELTVSAKGEGYRAQRKVLSIPRGESLEVDFVLDKDEADRSRRLVLSDGTPLAGAALLVFRDGDSRDEGIWNRACSRGADGEGTVDISVQCLESSRVVVLHPLAALEAHAGSDLAWGRELALRPAPQPPWTLLLTDEQGHPQPGVPISFLLDDLVVGPDQRVFAATRLARPIPVATDGEGRLVLDGVDPQSTVAPRLVVPGQEPFDLDGGDRERMVEWVLSSQ